MSSLRYSAGVAWVALLSFAPGAAVEACCPTYREGAEVRIADQEVLISWNSETQTEHFVRRATFYTAEPGFGFLVPTPTQPKLAEVSNDVFPRLGDRIKPEIRYVNRLKLDPFLLCLNLNPLGTLRGVASFDGADIRVLDRQRVAGYDAVVLEADDASALLRWLQMHGYESRRELIGWLEPYVAAHWKVTAFKYAASKPGGDREVATGSVRMTFTTDRPFFPYRVPEDQLAKRGQGRTLRLFYIGDTRVVAALGAARLPWPAGTKYSNRAADARDLLAGAVPPEDVPQGGWLTAFEDPTWPGGTDDLFFSPSPDPSPVIPPPDIRVTETEVPIPVDVLAAFAAVGMAGFWVVRRKKVPDT